MVQYITEPSVKTNPDLLEKIKLVQGSIWDQTDVDGLVFFMTLGLGWDGTLNQKLLEKAGQALDDYVLEHVYKPKAGDVFDIPAFDLPYKRLFLMLLPFWKDGIGSEEKALIKGYRRIVDLAGKADIKKLAIPAMGVQQRKKFPHKRAVRLSLNGIIERLPDDMEEVRIVSKNPEVSRLYQERLCHLRRKWAG